MFVVFIYGPAAAGKYTVGSLVSKQLEIPLFHNHLTVDLVKALFDFGSAPFRRLRAQIWKAAFDECARADKSFVFTFHPEATVDPSLISELTGIIESAGGSVFFVELRCLRSTVLTRISSEGRKQFGKLTDPSLYQAIEAQGGFEFGGMPQPNLVLDTDALQPQESAARVVAAI